MSPTYTFSVVVSRKCAVCDCPLSTTWYTVNGKNLCELDFRMLWILGRLGSGPGWNWV